jgi:hypothetical protein
MHSQFSDVREKPVVKDKFEWNSEDDDVDDNVVGSQLSEVNKRAAVQGRCEWRFHDYENYNGGVTEGRQNVCDILGFNPYIEILFFSSFS